MIVLENNTSSSMEQNTRFFHDPKDHQVAKRRTNTRPHNLLKQRDDKRDVEKRGNGSRCDTSSGSAVFLIIVFLGIVLCLLEVFFAICYIDNNFIEYNYNGNTPSHVAQSRADQNKGMTSPERKDSINPNQRKDRIMQIISNAGINDLDEETIRNLPTWSNVTYLYGDHPRIYGLDQCQVFQNLSRDPAERYVAVAGAFNSGTNLLSELLRQNCHMPERIKRYGSQDSGMRFQVPWGKHHPPSDEEFRLTHKTTRDKDIDANSVLPVVAIRDPYTWMTSMCRHDYTARWRHTKEHCPNLIPNDSDKNRFPGLKEKETVPITVKYNGFNQHHDSLAHMWNDWYDEYASAKFPRIIVRLEDLIFHPEEVTKMVCNCAGGEMNQHKFRYVADSAKAGTKGHGKNSTRTSFIDAIIRYGNATNRFQGFAAEDLLFAKNNLNGELMDFFHYGDPPLSLVN